MMESLPRPNQINVKCRLCTSRSFLHGQTDVLNKYVVSYFRCEDCGYIQTEEPYWLDEAYSSAIASQDVGILQRNLDHRDVTCAVLNLMFPRIRDAVDLGGGHGIFVRLMRDRGFNFYWSDLYASNDYARGFESKAGATYDFAAAFEVLEHLIDPLDELSPLMGCSPDLLVSTCLVPEPAPRIADWWYYVPTTGQHISFYTRRSLQVIARRFGRHLLSHGPFHLFSSEPKNKVLFLLATRIRVARIVNTIYRRPGLTQKDFEQMTR